MVGVGRERRINKQRGRSAEYRLFAITALVLGFVNFILLNQLNGKQQLADQDTDCDNLVAPTAKKAAQKEAATTDQSFSNVAVAAAHQKSDEDIWWQQYVDLVSVTYTPSNNTDWCQNMDGIFSWKDSWGEKLSKNNRGEKKFNSHDEFGEVEDLYPKTGMYMVKIPKTGSSTAQSVALQIAESVAAQKGFAEPCPHHTIHGKRYTEREKKKRSLVFLWTTVRQPHLRSISSYFFFRITRGRGKYNSQKLMSTLNRTKNYQIRYIGEKLTTPNYNTAEERENIPQKLRLVYDIFRTYNFIALTERMDESLVVMKLLFGFQDEAMVTFSGKRAGGFDSHGNQRCKRIQKSFTTDDVEKHIAVGGEYRKSNLDFFLYAVANRSLDRTIDFLGRERVEREVIRHQQLRKRKEDLCLNTTVFPCEEEGEPNPESFQSCYYEEIGCNTKCILSTS